MALTPSVPHSGPAPHDEGVAEGASGGTGGGSRHEPTSDTQVTGQSGSPSGPRLASPQPAEPQPASEAPFSPAPKAGLQAGDTKDTARASSGSVAASESSELGSEASSSMGLASSGSGPLAPHYDATQDVILRLEFLRTPEVKTIIRAVRAMVVVGLVILIITLAYKVSKPNEHFLQEDTVPVVNLAFAGVLGSALLACYFIFFYRVYRSNLTGKRWSHRRRRNVTLNGMELTVQLVNLIFFIVPNAFVLSHDCSWFHPLVLWSGFVRWTIWNTLFLLFWVQAHSANPARGRWLKYVDRPDAAIMDCPLYCHWPKLSLWLVLEGVLLALTVLMQVHPNAQVLDPSITDCRYQPYDCHFGPGPTALLSLNVACLVFYWLLYVYFITRALHNLKFKPYTTMRMANLTVRLQLRLRSLSIGFFVLCVVCYTFLELNTCSSYVLSWLGYLPMQCVMTATCIANAYISMPKRPHEAGILQVWLQEFAWTEAELPRKRAERVSSLPPTCPEGQRLATEPIFCFETAIKCMFWSFLVYDYGEKQHSAGGEASEPGDGTAGAAGAAGAAGPYRGHASEQEQVDAALALWDLEHFELFWERSLDTKAVVGWNEDTVAIAFRGTASLNNVRSDLQVWRARWPPGVGSPLLCTAPQVHKGFLDCFRANGFNDRLLERLRSILYRCSHRGEGGAQRPVNVYVTGHSLGGALATLCAYHIMQSSPCARGMVHMHCYTFGSPRPGNHAFAREYESMVPDTWCLINNDDVITKAGKFWTLYSRVGHRVLINRLGDLLVRPNYVETAIRGVPGGASVKDHLLTSYARALVAVVAAQFGRKSLQAGREGVLSLTQQKGVLHVLQTAGLPGREIQILQDYGWEAWRALTQSKKRGKRSRWRGSSRSSRSSDASVEAAAAAAVAGWELEGKEAAMLEAVVVEPAGPEDEQQHLGGAAAAEHDDAAAQPAAGAAAPGTAAAAAAGASAAAPGPVDVEAARPAEQRTVAEEGGVLHVQRMCCRRQCGRGSRTICSLLGKHPPAAAGAARVAPGGSTAQPASPMDDAPAVPAQRAQQVQQQQQAALHAIAEEEGEVGAERKAPKDSPPALPLPAQQPRRQRDEPWWHSLASKLGWEMGPRLSASSRTLSSGSLASTGDSSSPVASDINTRGSSRDVPAFPLVLDWGNGRGGGGGTGGTGTGGHLPDVLNGRAVRDVPDAQLAALGGAGRGVDGVPVGGAAAVLAGV